MNPTESLSFSEIIDELKREAAKMESGNLEGGEAERLVALSAALYERLVVLRHEANREMAEPVSVPLTEQMEVRTEPQAVTNKQINLLDAIEALEATSPAREETQPEAETAEEVAPVDSATVPESGTEPEPEPEPETVVLPVPTVEVVESKTEVKVAAEPRVVAKPKAGYQEMPEGPASINDKLSTAMPKRSLADKLALTPVADMKKGISLNLKFQFINELFGGDTAAFEAAVQKLNSAADYKAAMQVLEHELLSARGWDVESKVFLDLHTLVERRYL